MQASFNPVSSEQPRYRSGAVARMVRIPVATLRIWERRYQVVGPALTPSGHRLYDQQDLARVREVLRLLDANLPIRDAARLVQDGLPAPLPAGRPDNPWEPMRHRFLPAGETFDEGRLDSLDLEALAPSPVALVPDQSPF